MQQAAAGQDGSADDQETQEPGASQDGTLRERVFQYLRITIGETGARAIINFKQAAEQFGVTPVTFASHVKGLEEDGRVRRKSAGRRGTVVWLLSARPLRKGRPAPTRRPRTVSAGSPASARGPRRTSAASPDAATTPTRRPARAAAAGTRSGSFCPWCGHKTGKGWRFCGACGHSLASE